ncbi:MAG: elongation factor P [Rickettsiales bacterium]|nr:elongation factor P [Pseudomonadota bacterium]MDA0966779.1 elongation factor P [Pseudomonadota bacterium]MDG4543451.1 elongation factor P [Rickettsiales bacterium]MDG4546155.1 elongation factor P [Rickettsiales bacterium]MDG4547628.1 elongation factor P [Rickettsiales bacterium]
MKMSANNIRPGNVLVYNNRLWVVSKISHTQPGKGGAYIQTEMKDIQSGTKLNERFRSSEDVERAHLDEKEYQYLYTEGEELVLMDLDSYEQVHVPIDLVGEPVAFLQDEMMITVVSYENKPIAVELPEEVVVEVVEADAVVKGQTAASSNKPAILSNGVRIMVPTFVEAGNRVLVKTADGQYVERAKD